MNLHHRMPCQAALDDPLLRPRSEGAKLPGRRQVTRTLVRESRRNPHAHRVAIEPSGIGRHSPRGEERP